MPDITIYRKVVIVTPTRDLAPELVQDKINRLAQLLERKADFSVIVLNNFKSEQKRTLTTAAEFFKLMDQADYVFFDTDYRDDQYCNLYHLCAYTYGCTVLYAEDYIRN